MINRRETEKMKIDWSVFSSIFGLSFIIASAFILGQTSVMFSMGRGVENYPQVLGQSKRSSCAVIQDGTLLASDGSLIETGFDDWGYNYQAHLFNGTYCDSYKDVAWCQSYKDISLQMKWNEAWLSNRDCDGDGLIDRHFGFDSYIGSGAWLTNHQSGEYEGEDGENCQWTYFTKIVAAPADATSIGDIWFAPDGKEIGPVIWNEFAVIQEISNDLCGGQHGVVSKSEAPTGFGFYR